MTGYQNLSWGWPRNQRGVTGLETAIILIAFVVVASVFAFTVLSTGIFSSERGKETVFAGVQEARGTIEPKGAAIANGLTKDNLSLADKVWTVGSNATGTVVSIEASKKKEGTGSVKIIVHVSTTTALLAYENLVTNVDLTDQTQVQFWVRSSVATTAGQLEIVLDNTANCGSPEVHIDVPVLAPDTWKLVTAAITSSTVTTFVANADKSAVTCVGVEVETDLSTTQEETVYVDEIVGVGLVTTVEINLTNALKGEAVNLTKPSDADDDGIADSDGNHVLVITYTDKNQLVRDLFWDRTFYGLNDGDDLLEAGETVQLTVHLKGLAPATPLVKDQDFTLEIKPPIGAVLNLQRSIPAVIDTVMNLN